MKEQGLRRGARKILIKAQRRGSMSPEEVVDLLPVAVAADDKRLSRAIDKVAALLDVLGITIRISRPRKLRKGNGRVSYAKKPRGQESELKSEDERVPEFVSEKSDNGTVSPYYRQACQYPLLPPEVVIALSKRVRQKKDVRARNKLMVHNLRLSLKIAQWYMGRGVDYDDLVQEGNLGLMKAAERFDGRKGFQFSTYAIWWIRQYITRAIADFSRLIRMPVHAHHLHAKVMKAARTLAGELEREPTVEEVAARSGVSSETVNKVFTALQVPIVSLDAVIDFEDGETTAADFVPDRKLLSPIRVLEAKEELESATSEVRVLLTVLKCLGESERDLEIFKMTYGIGDDGRDDHTIDSIGHAVGLSRGISYMVRTRAWGKAHAVGIVLCHETLEKEIGRIRTLEDLVGKKTSFRITSADMEQARKIIHSSPSPSLPVEEDEIDKGSLPVSLVSAGHDATDQPLSGHASDDVHPDVHFEAIVKAVERYSGVRAEVIRKRGRSAKVALARQVAMYLVREDLQWSFPRIGLAFDGRDHTTVMHNCEMVEVLIKESRLAKREIDEIRALTRKQLRQLKLRPENGDVASPNESGSEEHHSGARPVNEEVTPELRSLADELASGWHLKNN